MGRLTEEETKEYQRVMADPQAASKFRLVIGGMLDEFDFKEAERLKKEKDSKPKSFLEDLDDMIFGRSAAK